MQLIERIKEKILKETMSVLTMSKQTGIPAYRIYKWIDGKGKPKFEDAGKLEKWLNGNLEKVQNGDVKKVSNPNEAAYLIGKLESKDEVLAEKEARRLEAERTAEYLKEQLAKEKADKDKLFAALEKAQDVLIKSTERLDANLIESLEHLRNLELKANIIAQQIEELPAVHEIMIPVEKKKVAASASKGGKSSGAHKKDGV